jgi:hypothetical protein
LDKAISAPTKACHSERSEKLTFLAKRKVGHSGRRGQQAHHPNFVIPSEARNPGFADGTKHPTFVAAFGTTTIHERTWNSRGTQGV